MGVRALPKVQIKDKIYFRDDRLKEFRNIENPHDRIDFKDVDWGKVITVIDFKEGAKMADHGGGHNLGPEKPEKSFQEYFREEVFMTRSWGPEVGKRLEEGKKIAQKKLKEDEDIEVDIQGLHTADQLEDRFDESLKAEGVPEKILSYIDYALLARDESWSGELKYIDVKPPGAEHTIRYFYWAR